MTTVPSQQVEEMLVNLASIDINKDGIISFEEAWHFLEDKGALVPKPVLRRIMADIAGRDGKVEFKEFIEHVANIQRTSTREATWIVFRRDLLHSVDFWMGSVSFFVPYFLSLGNTYFWKNTDPKIIETIGKVSIIMWTYACMFFGWCFFRNEWTKLRKREAMEWKVVNATKNLKDNDMNQFDGDFTDQCFAWLHSRSVVIARDELEKPLKKNGIKNAQDLMNWAKNFNPKSTKERAKRECTGVLRHIGFYCMIGGFWVGCILWLSVYFASDKIPQETISALNDSALVLFILGYLGFIYVFIKGFSSQFDRIEQGRQVLRDHKGIFNDLFDKAEKSKQNVNVVAMRRLVVTFISTQLSLYLMASFGSKIHANAKLIVLRFKYVSNVKNA